jgi:hypothetical protein
MIRTSAGHPVEPDALFVRPLVPVDPGPLAGEVTSPLPALIADSACEILPCTCINGAAFCFDSEGLMFSFGVFFPGVHALEIRTRIVSIKKIAVVVVVMYKFFIIFLL